MRAFFTRSFHFHHKAVVLGMTFLALLMVTSACDDVISGPDGTTGRVARAIKLDAATIALGRGATRQLEAIVLDQRQEPFTDSLPEGTRIEWGSSDTTIVFVSETGVITAKGTGEARVSATLASAIGRPSVGATVIVATGAHRIEGVSGSEQEDTVKSTLEHQIVVRAFDENDQPVSGVMVNFTVEEGGGTPNPASALTDEEGFARTTWTFGTKSGTWQVEASLADNPAAYTYISAVALPGNAKKLEAVSGSNQTGTVGGTLSEPLVVRVLDSYDNPIPNKQIRWEPSDFHHGSHDPAESITDQDGFSSTMWTLGTVTGLVRSVARSDGLPPVEFRATAQAAEPTTYSLVIVSGNGQYAPQLHRLPEPLKVRLIDGHGRPVPGRYIIWDTPSHNGTIDMNGEATDDNGEFTADWILGTGEGTQTVTVRTRDVPGDPTATFVAHAGKSPRMIRISYGEDLPVVYGEPTREPIVVRVLSFDTMPVRGVRVDWSLDPDDQGHIQVLSEYTNAQGEVSVIYTPKGGSGVVPSFDDPINGHRQLFVPVKVYHPVGVESGDGQSGPINQKLPETLRVRVLDDEAQPIVGRRVTWTVTRGGGTMNVLDGGVTDADGYTSAEWTLGSSIGLQTVVAKAEGITKYQAEFRAEGLDPTNPLRRLNLQPAKQRSSGKVKRREDSSVRKGTSTQKTPARIVRGQTRSKQ